jgi:xanthine/CO dehydrogenase XdhC/CoxF family maturation factor
MSTASKEQTEIFALYESLRASGGGGVLATIVSTSGSTYRRAGARMLVSDDGRSAGLISGGCLESDLRERSAAVAASGRPLLVTYDSTSPGDILWGLGLGCTGIARVLLERVRSEEACVPLEFIEQCRHGRRAGAIATTYVLSGITGELAAPRVFVDDGHALPGTLAGDSPEEGLRRACAQALAGKESSHIALALAGRSAEAFIEYIAPPVPLFVFGAGPDAAPLVRLAKELGWHVTVVDGRPAYLTRTSFPSADELFLSRPGEFRDRGTLPRGAAAVIMTHNFNDDASLLGTLLASEASYVGLLGPRAKADLLFSRLAEEGTIPAEDAMARFHSPIGLDIGAETPEEIALAIVAEIQASLNERSGEPLRRREGSIHR